MSSDSEDWEDFTHHTQSAVVSAQGLFESYRAFRNFVDKISRKELVARRWLKTVDDDSPLATIFFELPITRQATLFRKSNKADENLLAIWRARAKGEAQYSCLAENIPSFNGLTKESLRSLAHLSVDPNVVRQMPALLAKSGVILVYIYALPGMNADGAVFRLSTGHPVIAMSLRFPRLDYFWFTLLHELAHLVLHFKQLDDQMPFDVEAEDTKDRAERAANRLAQSSMVDQESWRNCAPRYDTSDQAVRTYAAQQGVHPSLIAGLLRKETGNYVRYSSIINEHDVRKIIFRI